MKFDVKSGKRFFKVIKDEFKMLPQLLKVYFSTKKSAYYVGCTGMGNLGDEVVFSATVSILKNISIYNIPYVNPQAGKIGRKLLLRNIDYLILGGGTIIKKDANSGYLKVLNNLHKKYPHSKIIVFGAGVADPILAKDVGFPTNILDWSILLNKCSFVAVRGLLSRELLKGKEWSVNKEIHVLHDPALHLLNKTIQSKPKLRKIGLNFCDIIGRIYGQDEQKVEIFVNKLIDHLLKESWEIYLYPTVSSDIEYMKRIINPNLFHQINVYHNFIDVKDSLRFFNEIDVFVGQRLHAVIFSSITYTPFHAIEYESKTSDYLLSLGLEGYSSRTDNLDFQFVVERIDYLYQYLDNEQKKLFELCQIAHAQQKEISLQFPY